MPIINKFLISDAKKNRLSGGISAAIKPIANEPITLTRIVPQGNDSPNTRMIRLEQRCLPIPPIALPSPIHK